MSCRNKSITSQSVIHIPAVLRLRLFAREYTYVVFTATDVAGLGLCSFVSQGRWEWGSSVCGQCSISPGCQVVTVASFTAFPACFLLHPLSFSTHTFIRNVFSPSIIYKNMLKKHEKRLKGNFCLKVEPKLIFPVCGQEFESISKRPSSFVYGEGAKMIATGCIWSRWLQQSSADSWEGFALLGFTATWESSCFAKSHFMALWGSGSGAGDGLRQGTGKQVAMALGFMVKRYHSSSHSLFYFR